MIRYKINVVQALKTAGYSPTIIRENKILSESTMSKFRRNDTSITLENLDIVCTLLNCQPSDLIEFVPNLDKQDKP